MDPRLPRIQRLQGRFFLGFFGFLGFIGFPFYTLPVLLHTLAIIATLLASPASAASGDALTDSGAMLQAETISFSGMMLETKLDLLEERMGPRLVIPAQQLVTQSKVLQANRMRQEHDRERRASAMEECRSQLRKANRDGKFPVMLRCIRAFLLQDVTAQRRRETDIAERTDVSAVARESALATARALTDALVTVVNAIDTGVYNGQEDLEEMKARLFAAYRLPDLQSDVRLRIDRHRQWLTLVIARMRLLATEESPRSEEVRLLVDQTAICLWTALDAVDGASSTEDVVLAAKDVQVYERSLASCLPSLRAAARILVDERLPPKAAN